MKNDGEGFLSSLRDFEKNRF